MTDRVRQLLIASIFGRTSNFAAPVDLPDQRPGIHAPRDPRLSDRVAHIPDRFLFDFRHDPDYDVSLGGIEGPAESGAEYMPSSEATYEAMGLKDYSHGSWLHPVSEGPRIMREARYNPLFQDADGEGLAVLEARLKKILRGEELPESFRPRFDHHPDYDTSLGGVEGPSYVLGREDVPIKPITIPPPEGIEYKKVDLKSDK